MFNFHVISGMLTEAGFGFATRGEGKDWKNGMYIPSSTASGLLLVLKPVSFSSVTRNADSLYAASRSFDD